MPKKIMQAFVAFLVFVVCFASIQRLFMPKYMSDVYEGALIAEYYDDSKQNQVIFIGDCEVYENYSPITLWENYGISSYIRGAPQQLIWQSYYMLEDTLKYETPELVVFNVLSMRLDSPQSEAYNRLNLDGMRLSATKLRAAQASMTDGESLLSYIFPLARYHDRWDELCSDDLRYFFSAKQTGHSGYFMQSAVKPVDVIPEGQPLADYEFSPVCYEYLDKMTALCKANNIELVLVKAPSIYPYWYPQWDEQIKSYSAEHDLLYINFLEHVDEIGIDYTTDSFDAGLHLNVHGAEKLSDYLGGLLTAQFQLEDMRSDEALCAAWAQKCADYYQMKQQQISEFEENAAVHTYTY